MNEFPDVVEMIGPSRCINPKDYKEYKEAMIEIHQIKLKKKKKKAKKKKWLVKIIKSLTLCSY